MRSPPSSSCSNSSSSCSSSSLAATSLANRLETIFKKASELTTLCDIEACVIHYGPDGELKTWPKDRQKVRDLALRYSRLDEAKRRKKSVSLYGFLKKNKTKATNLQKKTLNQLKYPLSDHYSPDQISQLIQSLERNRSILQERRRFVESQKQAKAKLEDHKGLTSSSLNHQDHHQQTQSLNSSNPKSHSLDQISISSPVFERFKLSPSKFSLVMYNHEDATLSQIPLSASNFNQFTNFSEDYSMHQELNGRDQNIFMGNINSNSFQGPCVSNTQDYTALPIQESVNSYGLNHLMQPELCGFDQSMCMSDITNSNNFQHTCVSNTQNFTALPSELQEYVTNFGLNHLTQQEPYGFDQSMCTSDTINSNVLDPCLSNTVSDEFCSELQDPYGCMVGNSGFSQDLSDMFLSYGVQFDESSLLQTSTLPSLYTIPNS